MFLKILNGWFPKGLFGFGILGSLILGGAALGSAYLANRNKNKGGGGGNNQIQIFRPEPFGGQRPFEAGAVGLGSEQLQPLSQQFIEQIMRRSRGEGLVGFGDEFVQKASGRLRQTLGEQQEDARRRQQAQASSQGLRGGIPVDISRQRQEDFADALSKGLTDIELQDLAAKREDRNLATFAQPEVVSQGAGIQQNRSNFDLAEFIAEQPTIVAPGGGISSGSSLASSFGNLLGPAVNAAGSFLGGLGGGVPGQEAANKSLSDAALQKLLGGGPQQQPLKFQFARQGF